MIKRWKLAPHLCPLAQQNRRYNLLKVGEAFVKKSLFWILKYEKVVWIASAAGVSNDIDRACFRLQKIYTGGHFSL